MEPSRIQRDQNIASPVQPSGEKTEIIYGIENVMKFSLDVLPKIRASHNVCLDSDGITVIIAAEPVRQIYQNLYDKGVRVRVITNIASENLSYCTQAMKFAEVRHLDGLKGNFSVSDNELYTAAATVEAAQPLPYLMVSSARHFVEQQQYFFETLWEKAVPASIRIRQLESGIEPEKSDIIYDPKKIINLVAELIASAKLEVDNCVTSLMPERYINDSVLREGFISLKKRGVALRFITEVTSENVRYCEALAEVVQLRHLDNIKGNFGIIDGTKYAATALMQQGERPPQLVFSTVREFVQQQQFFFETLWGKAIPAEQRIAELEQGIEPERTEVLYGEENAMRVFLDSMAKIKKEAVTVGEAGAPQFTMTIDRVKQQFADLKRRGVRMRAITEVTRDNLPYVREQTQYMEVRHLDGVKGNFGVSESEYVASVTVKGSRPLVETIYSTARAVIEQHHYLFETLWSRAIPAEQKIREIEEGRESEYHEVIRDGTSAVQTAKDLISGLRTDAQIMLPLSQGLVRANKASFLKQIINAARAGVRIQLICPIDEGNRQLAQILLNTPNIRLLNAEPATSAFFIIDSTRYMRAEIKNPDADSFETAWAFLEHSNSRSAVEAFRAFFNVLWKQAEQYELLQTSNVMQKEFISTAAHEMRNPIQPILGLAEILRDRISDKEAIPMLDAIIRNAKKLAQLEENILDMTRIENHNLQLNVEKSVDLKEIISLVMAEYETMLNGLGKIELKSSFQNGGKIHVDVDRARVGQVLSNLLSNAIKFTKEGSITIAAEKSPDKTSAIVYVRDTGTGIDQDILPRLFTKFVTKSHRGTGLGLYVCKNIIEAHGGRMWAENNLGGKGATFGFSLPLERHA